MIINKSTCYVFLRLFYVIFKGKKTIVKQTERLELTTSLRQIRCRVRQSANLLGTLKSTIEIEGARCWLSQTNRV